MTMSGMLTRTWNYLHQVTLDPGPGWSVPTKDQRHHLPPGLASWLHQVTSCLDTDEEREMVSRQMEVIISKLSSKSCSPGVSGDCLVRLVHIHLLGYDTSPAFIHCVKLAGTGSILSRKLGYLAVSVMIPPGHDLMVLVTNTILRDLASSNLVDIQLGLVAAANLITRSLISLVPVLVEKVVALLRQSCHLVRKKSVTVLDHLCDLEPSCWTDVCPSVIGCLADSNPGVAVASVQVLSRHLTSRDGESAVKLAVMVSLELHQMMTSEDCDLPSDYQYRGHTAPHLQIYCTRVYRRAPEVVIGDPDLSDRVISQLQSSLNVFTGCKDLIIQALIYETVLTISSLSTASCLLPLALRSVGGFLTSRHHSTVYTGLCALDAIFRQRPPRLTEDQEAAVLTCLGHSDPAIQRRAAELLLVVASQENVMSIVDRVLAHVAGSGSNSNSDYSMVVDRVVILVERFGDSVQDCDWKASTLLRIVQVSKNDQRDKIIERLKFLLTSSDEGDAATILELNRVRIRLRKLLSDIVTSRQEAGRPVPPPVTSLQVWCDAQFCDPEEEDTVEIVRRTVDTARANTEHAIVTLHCISALQTLIMREGRDSVGELGLDFINECSKSDQNVVSLRARTASSVIRHAPSIAPPAPQSSPDLTLSFLDRYIASGLREGRMQPYRPRQSSTSQEPGLITSPYNVLSRSSRDSERSWSPDQRDVVMPPVRTVWTAEGRLESPEPILEEEQVEVESEAENNDQSDKIQESSSNSVLTGDWD